MMNFDNNSYLNNNQQYLQPNFQKIEYNSYETDFDKNINNNIISQDIYQTNYEERNQIEDHNGYTQYFNQNVQNNDINLFYPENTINQINLIPNTNIEEQQYNYNSTYEQNINNQIDYNVNNHYINYTDNNLNVNTMINNNEEQQNKDVKEDINNAQNNNLTKNDVIKNENDIDIYSDIQDNPINSNKEEHNEEENINNKKAISINDSELPNTNKEIKDHASSHIPRLNSEDLNQSFPNGSKNLINSKIINSPIMNNNIQNQKAESENGEKILQNQINEINYSYDFNKEEEKYLRNREEYKKTEFDFKSHFKLTFTKEQNNFFYNNIHKIITPLYGHIEMPDNLEYKSPILSPNQKYLACIGFGDKDWAFVWEMSNLYWYKYKFSFTKIDCIIFTPNSKSLIIVYKNSIPIMYDLSTGKMNLRFQKNGEEKNRESYQCSFTTVGSHFALTSTKSYTLWSLKNGKVLLKIEDNSPVKIISGEYIINVDSKLNCVIMKIWDQSIKEKFEIKGISTPQEILDGRCDKDMNNFLYAIKEGIIIYNFKNKEYTGLQKFDSGVENAIFSFDAKYILKTNMKNLCINDLEKGKNICTKLKNEFKEIKVDFNLKKLITIDNISITIQELYDEQPEEKHIWLNKNPKNFIKIKFSKNYDYLLAKISNNEIVIYDLKTGFIIKKFENREENLIDFDMTNHGNDRIAIKSNLNLIKIWNFITKKEEATFYGYNSNSLLFSGDGYYLACGIKKGSEIARIWDIDKQKYGIFRYNGSNDNLNTIAHLTSPKPKRLICLSEKQEPLIFNAYTKDLLFKCECPVKFEQIYEIQSDLKYDIFIIKGKNEENKNMGIMYKISDGSLVQIYENYTNLELTEYGGILITKCDNINGGKLTSIDLNDKNEQKLSEFQIQTNKCEILNDQKCAMIIYGDTYCKEFNLFNIKNGNFMGKINYVQNIDRNTETHITAEDNEIYFRYFEFLSPEDTMAYLKKNVCVVEGEYSK